MRGGNQSTEHECQVKAIRQYLHYRGFWFLKVAGGAYQRPGLPDFLACKAGRLIAVEVKTGHATLSATQARERTWLEDSGALYILAHTVDDVETALLQAGLVECAALA